MLNRPSGLMSPLLVLACLVALAAGAAALATLPRAQASPPGGEALSAHVPHAITLQLTAPLSQGVARTFTVHVAATEAAGAGAAQVVLRLPSYLSVIGGMPGGYSAQPSDPPTPRTFDVIWSTYLAVGVTQTFTLNVVPLAASTSRYHDQVAAFVYQSATMPSRYAGASDALWVRVGAPGTPGTVSSDWPNALAILSAGYEALPDDGSTVVQVDSAGNATPLPALTDEELPEHEPLSTWLSFGTFVDASTPITAALTAHNTVSQTVSYTGTLTLPEGWHVLAGAASWTETLAPDEQVVHSYLVLPSVIRCTWKATVALRVNAATCANGHRSVLMELEGGLGHSHNLRHPGPPQAPATSVRVSELCLTL